SRGSIAIHERRGGHGAHRHRTHRARFGSPAGRFRLMPSMPNRLHIALTSMMAGWFRVSILPLLVLGMFQPGRAEQVLQVPEGADLQQALDRARPGDTILLRPGARYIGNFVLPKKEGSQYITIRTADVNGQPAMGMRVHPSHESKLAKIGSPNGQPALRTAAGAHHWRIQVLEFLPNRNGAGDIITLGDAAERDLNQVPHDLIVDRCYIHGDPALGQKRGIALNSGTTVIRGSRSEEHTSELQSRDHLV